MRETKDLPILTDTFDRTEDFRPEENSIYIFALTGERRASHTSAWASSIQNVKLIEVCEETQISFKVKGKNSSISPRSELDVKTLWAQLTPGAKVYLDITGLTHSVWAGILKSAILAKLEVLVVYVEPDAYSRSAAPVEGQIYDLSTSIQGISPLPGFATLSSRSSDLFTFVPLLGFEGPRLRYIVEQIQPGYEYITPIVGSPGFKSWYVFETYVGNKDALTETSAWQAVRYAPANCPFSCYYLLEEISEDNQGRALKIALIGTKPHALGAVLFTLASSTAVELVHDHPIRKAGRTGGTARLLVYHVSALFDDSSSIHVSRTTPRSRRSIAR
ncbi:hypothetical protein ALP10_00699 [Pseudomonas syringae pv. helianthi]|uniref:Uncharacterized protein n=1 Tax=Pseudomonas syringae pv. helianthi TaxID=251654 RepID=A0A3M6D7F0_9PSED|nr:hypothetical protein [Pseudomonas syringae group genomosp. 7]RMV51481.1 hypothetical protein ALP10_00699 [Pseudomonas syringae pv. helianthi]